MSHETGLTVAKRAASRLWWRGIYPRMPAGWKLPAYYRYFRYKGLLEPEFAILRHVVPRDRVAVDVGANVGLYAYRLAGLCTRVEAFEPNPECAALLRSYDHPNIRVHSTALSSGAGVAELNIPTVSGRELAGHASMAHVPPGDTHRTLSVRTDTLDSQKLRDVGFIKIDVEGHEGEVILGARASLRLQRPVLMIEIEQRHLRRPIREVFDLIADQGYRGYFLLGGRLQPLSTFSFQLHQNSGAGPSGSSPYVNNFLFLCVEDTQLPRRLRECGLLPS